MNVRCPECKSPIVDLSDIFFENQEVLCRGGCNGTRRKHNTLSECELPPPKRRKRPEECEDSYVQLVRDKGPKITVTVPKNNRSSSGVAAIILGIFFFVLASLLITQVFEEKPHDPPDLFLISFTAGMVLVGIGAIAYGLRDIYGGIRAAIVDDELLFGKTFGSQWFKRTFDLDELALIRRVSLPNGGCAVGFFLKDVFEPLVLKAVIQGQDEVDWLVWEFYDVKKRNDARHT